MIHFKCLLLLFLIFNLFILAKCREIIKGLCKNNNDCNILNLEFCQKNTCITIKGNKQFGELCGTFTDCDDYLVCDGKSRTCKSVYKCNTSNDCSNSLYCIDGNCRGQGKKGQSCKSTLQCTGALVCNNGVCGDILLKK